MQFIKFLFAGGENKPYVKGKRIGGGGGGGGRRVKIGGEREEHKQGHDEGTKELLRVRKKILGGIEGGSGGGGGKNELKRVFRAMDSGGRGNVSMREFASGLRRVGVVLQRSDQNTLFKRFDTNDDGLFDYEDFLNYLFHPEKGGGGGKKNRSGRVKVDDYYGSDDENKKSRGNRRGGNYDNNDSSDNDSNDSDDDSYDRDGGGRSVRGRRGTGVGKGISSVTVRGHKVVRGAGKRSNSPSKHRSKRLH